MASRPGHASVHRCWTVRPTHRRLVARRFRVHADLACGVGAAREQPRERARTQSSVPRENRCSNRCPTGQDAGQGRGQRRGLRRQGKARPGQARTGAPSRPKHKLRANVGTGPSYRREHCSGVRIVSTTRVHLLCNGCGHRFGPRSRLYAFPGTATALCDTCVGLSRWPRIHRQLWVGCSLGESHDPIRDHDGLPVTVAGFRYLQSHDIERFNDVQSSTAAT